MVFPSSFVEDNVAVNVIMDSYSLRSVLDLPSDINMVISAPTGSGKTVLFELCMLRLLSKFISAGRFVHIAGTRKTIYVAPSKALVQEKLRDWKEKFGSWGVTCLELTGDNEFYNVKSIQEADIILTTPEKFDAVTRYRINDGGLSFFSDIALLIIDEVHLLNDPRGAALEAVVSRIKMLARSPGMKSSPLASVRLLAVSATIPNIQDLAEWLEVPAQGIKRFGEEMRPVKLTTKVFGYAPAKNDFLFEKRLQNYVFDILMQYSRGKSALVFCSTRKGAQEAAQQLSRTAMNFGHSNPFVKDVEQLERLREASLSCSDKQMQAFIPYGVGYHNGGLCLKDRSLVENLFLKGDIRVLCATNTLAHGINLPAHTVVINNKEKGMYTEYDRSTVLQMCGRAGRPPFDDTGMVIIMTRRETVHLYENLLNGCEMVESQLLPCLTEHLTAEIVQLTIFDITRAIEWIKCSYLYVRIRKNPEKYSVRKVISRERIEKQMQGAVLMLKVNELSDHQLIWTDEDGFLLKPLEPGKLMTKYYLKFDTMKHIMQTPANCSLEDALNSVCHAEEISWIQLRRNEKKVLNDINADKDGRLRFHINGDKGKRKKRIQTREEKIFILANDCLTGDPSIHDLSLTQDTNSICANGCRIARCMKEYFLFKKNYKGALSSALLAKSLYQKLWDDSPYLLKQLPGIGMVTAKALHSMGVVSFQTLAEADPRRIEIVTGRKYPFGNHIKESLLSLPPKVDMKVAEIEPNMHGKSKLIVTLTRLSQPIQSMKRHYADMIVGSEEDNIILSHEKIRLDEFSSPYSATILVSSSHEGKLTVQADLIYEEYIGLDLHHKLLLKKKNNSSSNYMPVRKPTSFIPLPEEVYVIEDDNETASETKARKVQSKMENSPMPSFSLLDEELEAEVELPVEMNHGDDDDDDDDCRIITEQTVFDHIRKKAKNFPALTKSENTHSPSLKPIFGSKGLVEELHNLYHQSDVLQHTEKTKIPELTAMKQSLNQDKADQNACDGYKLRDTGWLPEELEEINFDNFTEEEIFNNIRKKAKTFQVFNTSAPESFIQTKEYSAENLPQISDVLKVANSNLSPPITVISDSGEKTGNACKKAAGENEKHYTSSRIPCQMYTPKVNSNNIPSANMLSFDVSMLNGNNKRVAAAGGGNSWENASKKLMHSPNGQLCSLASSASKTREVDSFLGFSSVFSFL
ncbi:hypothetical protein ACFE04_010249 [Oxalis oulophora]